MLPSWVAEVAHPRPAPARRGSGVVPRMLEQTGRFVQEAVFAEGTARRAGFLQRLDARVKVVSVLGLIVAAAFLHHLPMLWFVGAFAVGATLASGIRARELLNRAWWTLPATFVLVAAPAVLNVVTPGETLVRLVRFGAGAHIGPVALPTELTVTRQGLASAVLVVSRIAVGVLLAVMVGLTTRWQALLKAASTGATAAFVMVLGMMYRYVFVLLRVVEDMHFAKRARTIVPESAREERRWVGGRVGALFLRSRRLTERVYDAMIARGYSGEAKALVRFRFGLREALWSVGCTVVAVMALIGDRVFLAGLPW